MLDVDTGVDDAGALLLAALHPGLDLRAVTCVEGNAALPAVVRNTLTVLEVAGRTDVPVAAGAARPLLGPAGRTRPVHGGDGMGDLGLAPPTLAADPRPAVDLLRTVIDEQADLGAPLTLVASAPLTNVALLARTHPDSVARLGRIVFVGGAARVGDGAEFNVGHDPHAAAIMIEACAEHGVPVTMYGLDVFRAPTVTAARGACLRALGTPVGELAGGLVAFACRRFAAESATIGDAGAVASLLAPGSVRTARLPVRVERAGTGPGGRTVVGLRDRAADDPHGPAPSLVEVAMDIDGATIADLWWHTIRGAA